MNLDAEDVLNASLSTTNASEAEDVSIVHGPGGVRINGKPSGIYSGERLSTPWQ